ncbi:MAG: hypothetical protein ABFD24_09445 [Anaerolineaceae bacterium]
MDTQTQIESSQNALKNLTEIRAGWIEMGRHYMDDLVKITLELGHPVMRSGATVFTTQNLTLIYRLDEHWVPLGGVDPFNNPFRGQVMNIMVTAGNFIDLEKKCGYRGRDAELQLREHRVAVLHSANFDFEKAGMPAPYELFIPNFNNWLDEALSYLPEANHRVELRILRALDSQVQEIRNELFLDGPVSFFSHAPNVAQ